MEGINCLQLLVDGNRDGLGCLYKLFAKDLYRYGLSICGNVDRVEECIHDFFVFLWEKRDKFENVDNPKAYLFTSFRRRLIKLLENEKKSLDFDIKYVNETAEESHEDALIQGEINSEYIHKLQKAIKTLSDREREVIHLKYFEKYSNEDITEQLGISYQSVRNLLYRAIQNLRKNL